MTQKIIVVLARTMCDPEAAWAEHKTIEIEIENDGYGKWHVVGEMKGEEE